MDADGRAHRPYPGQPGARLAPLPLFDPVRHRRFPRGGRRGLGQQRAPGRPVASARPRPHELRSACPPRREERCERPGSTSAGGVVRPAHRKVSLPANRAPGADSARRGDHPGYLPQLARAHQAGPTALRRRAPEPADIAGHDAGSAAHTRRGPTAGSAATAVSKGLQARGCHAMWSGAGCR